MNTNMNYTAVDSEMATAVAYFHTYVEASEYCEGLNKIYKMQRYFVDQFDAEGDIEKLRRRNRICMALVKANEGIKA